MALSLKMNIEQRAISVSRFNIVASFLIEWFTCAGNIFPCNAYFLTRITVEFVIKCHQGIKSGNALNVVFVFSGVSNLSRDAKNPVFGVSYQVRHKPAYAAAEEG